MIAMIKQTVLLSLQFIKLFFFSLCLLALYLVAHGLTVLIGLVMIVFTDWSAVTMGIALFPIFCLYYIVYKIYLEPKHTKVRSFLCDQIRKLKPNPETHCLTCGYDLRGLKIIRCPECGKFNPKFNPHKFLDQNQTHKKQNKKWKQRKQR